MTLAAVTLGAALLRPQDALLIGLVTLSIVPIALQLDWLALVDDRAALAAVLLLVRPLVFLALVGLCRADLTPTLLAVCYLACLGAVGAGVLHGAASYPRPAPRRAADARGACCAAVPRWRW